MNDRLLSFLGLCRRAGYLIYGADTVQKSIREGKTVLALAAADISPHSLGDTAHTAEQRGVRLIALPYPKAELSAALGKSCGIIGITDRGFAQKILTMITDSAARADTYTNTPHITRTIKEE